MSRTFNLSNDKINELQDLVERMEKWNRPFDSPWDIRCEEAKKFLYDNNLIIIFNWGNFGEQAFFEDDDPNKYSKIGRRFILVLLTAVARSDRFCTGAWDALFESGEAQNLFKRLLETYTERIKRSHEEKIIEINEHSFGPNTYNYLALCDITINISDHVSDDPEAVYLHGMGESIMSITCKGLPEKESMSRIDTDKFDKYFETIENIDFEKIYSEHSGEDCYDGWKLMIYIRKSNGFLSYKKQIILFSPSEDEHTPETNKLLKIYKEIKRLPEYKKYYRRIESKRKRLERNDNEADLL
jgi:hypothetical protein